MQGEINYRSQLAGGSTFWFSIPYVAASIHEKSEIPQNNFSLPAGFSANVLVVEDNQLNQKIAKLLLEELGCTVDIAGTGAEALKAIEQHTYDIVFMDLGLPDIDGYNVTRKIRKNFEDLMIIGLTAHADSEDMKKCLHVKMNDVLTKPVSLNDFSRVLGQLAHK
jgi:CheY-like chemotaxis protein